jgi:hypothetical protein
MGCRHSRLVLTFGSLLLAGTFLPGRAWDAGGHLVVATIAFDHLNPKARAEAEALAPQMVGPVGSYDPITVACWMDDLRGHHPGLPYGGLFAPWHYIDLGIGPNDPQPVLEPGQDNETSGNIVTALKRAMVVLQGGADPYIKSKAMAYAMVMHLVGDIHQPLHAGTYYYQGDNGRWYDDAGGNKVVIVNGPESERAYNLHYFWDSAWRVSFDADTGRVAVDTRYESRDWHDPQSVRALASEWEKSFAPSAQTAMEPDFAGWAEESNQLVREIVYPHLTFTENHKVARISAEYVALAEPLARKRLVLAGFRLAALLNATLGADSPGPIPPSYPPGPPSAILPEITWPAPPNP